MIGTSLGNKWTYIGTDFPAATEFMLDTDIRVNGSGSFAIYLLNSAGNGIAMPDGSYIDGFALWVQDATRVTIKGWDLNDLEWVLLGSTDYQYTIASIGLKFTSNQVIGRVNGEDVIGPVAVDLSSFNADSLQLMLQGDLIVIFDNICAEPIAAPLDSLDAPANLRSSLDGRFLTISWDTVDGATGYRFAFGMQAGNYQTSIDMGNITSLGPVDVSSVPPGTYFVAVQAYNTSTQSPFCKALSLFIPAFVFELQAPGNLHYETEGASLWLLWNAVPNADGYRLQVGTQSGSYLPPIDVGNIIQLGPLDIRTLPTGSYYLAVKAYDTEQEGPLSKELELHVGGQVEFEQPPLVGGVSGSHVSKPSGNKTTFSAMPLPEDIGTARYETAASGEILDVRVETPTTGHLIWKGMQIDGNGALTREEEAALAEMATSELYSAIMMVPLEIACSATVDPASPALAALLLPWQLVLKYLESERGEAVRRVADGVTCSFFPESNSKQPPGGDSPKQAAFILSNEAPLPVVLGYFPMDADGAFEMRKTVNKLWRPGENPWFESPIGPCKSKCRGACGYDCPVGAGKNCERTESWVCLEDFDTGDLTGYSRKRVTYKCKTHEACIEHDDCYDDCNKRLGCSTIEAAICRHAQNPLNPPPSCDSKAIGAWGLNVVPWAQGKTAGLDFTGERTFRYWTESILGGGEYRGADPKCKPPWALSEVIPNPDKEQEVYQGGPNGMPPGYFPEERYQGKYQYYSVYHRGIFVHERHVDGGRIWHYVKIASIFEKWIVDGREFTDYDPVSEVYAPKRLKPGQTVEIIVGFSHSGSIQYGTQRPGIIFSFHLDGKPLDYPFYYYPWSEGFDGTNSTTYKFVVPPEEKGEFELMARWNRGGSTKILWKYKAE
jgi:hypothetical protein